MTETRPSVLIVGGDGFIGKSLTRKLQTAGWSVFSTTRRPELVCSTRPFLDLLRPELNVGANTLGNVSHAIICGGITSIASCEKDPIGTHTINVDGVTHLAKRIIESGINLTFLSSSTVFDGTMEAPLPIDRPNPTCEYGRQKFATEQILTAFGKQSKIIRLTKVVNPQNSIFSAWISDLRYQSEIFAVNDAYVAPISIEYCTSFVAGILFSNQSGIFHTAPSSAMTYYEIATYIALRLGLNVNLVKAIRNGQQGTYVTKAAQLGGVSNDTWVPPQPRPEDAIDDLACRHKIRSSTV